METTSDDKQVSSIKILRIVIRSGEGMYLLTRWYSCGPSAISIVKKWLLENLRKWRAVTLAVSEDGNMTQQSEKNIAQSYRSATIRFSEFQNSWKSTFDMIVDRSTIHFRYIVMSERLSKLRFDKRIEFLMSISKRKLNQNWDFMMAIGS
jgi:hypothetical protein